MTAALIVGQKLFVGGYHLSSAVNALALAVDREAKDVTTLANDTHVFMPGLKQINASYQGFIDDAVHGSGLYDGQATTDEPFSIAAGQNAAVGDAAYFFKSMQTKFNQAKPIGEVEAFEIEAAATSQLVRGVMAQYQTALAATANGDGQQLGAVSSTQKLVAALHVFGAAGTTPTLDVTIQSAATGAFSSTTTRLTFGQKTAIGSDWQELNGAITHEHFRVRAVVGGTDPIFGFAVFLGIANQV